MVLAGNRPDLRGVIVDNPGCSPELRAWVSRMGGASAGPGGEHGGRGGPEAAAARTGGSDGVDDADDAVSLAPTGWEPSDIGLGEDPFQANWHSIFYSIFRQCIMLQLAIMCRSNTNTITAFDFFQNGNRQCRAFNRISSCAQFIK